MELSNNFLVQINIYVNIVTYLLRCSFYKMGKLNFSSTRIELMIPFTSTIVGSDIRQKMLIITIVSPKQMILGYLSHHYDQYFSQFSTFIAIAVNLKHNFLTD